MNTKLDFEEVIIIPEKIGRDGPDIVYLEDLDLVSGCNDKALRLNQHDAMRLLEGK